jgi:tRNA A37 threonylcarbamoyladenosine synthetase subunit TsaC/SUA5/YrdC
LRTAWPAPLSAVVRVATPVAWGAMQDGICTAAIRVPSDATLRRIVAAAGGPVLSTSANRTGESPCADATSVIELFADRVDLVVESSRPSMGQASTLVDATAWPLRVLRAGAFDVDRVRERIAS